MEGTAQGLLALSLHISSIQIDEYDFICKRSKYLTIYKLAIRDYILFANKSLKKIPKRFINLNGYKEV